MKKTALVIGGMLALSLVANTFGETTNVYSKNAVGYVNISLPVGYTLVSVPLDKTSTTPLTIDDVFGTRLPSGSTIYMFTPPAGPYTLITYLDGLGWANESFSSFTEGTNYLPRNRGFWLEIPPEGSATNISIVGEVPGQGSATTVVSVAQGFAILSFPYPVARNLSQTQLGQQGQDGDTLYLWNGATYNIYTFIGAMGGWLNESFAVADPVLDPGKSFWYTSEVAGRNLNETKPYTFP